MEGLQDDALQVFYILTNVDKVELVSIGINLIALDIILMLKVH